MSAKIHASTSPSDNRFILYLHPSRRLLAIFLFICLTASLAIIYARIGLLPKFVGLVTISTCAMIELLRWRQAPVYRLQKIHQQWQLLSENSDQQILQIKSCDYWSSILIVLKVYTTEQHKKYLPVLPDMCPEADFHRLKVICRFDL